MKLPPVMYSTSIPPGIPRGAGNGPILLEETKEMSQVSHTPWDQTYFFAQNTLLQ